MFVLSGLLVGLVANYFTEAEANGTTALITLTGIGFAALAVALTALSIFVSLVTDAYLRILALTEEGIGGYIVQYLVTAMISSLATVIGAVSALVYNALPAWTKAALLGLEAGLVAWAAWGVFQIVLDVATHGLNRYAIPRQLQEMSDPDIEEILRKHRMPPTVS